VYHVDAAPRPLGQPSYVPPQPAASRPAAPARKPSITVLPGSMAEAESLKLAWSTSASAKGKRQQDAQHKVDEGATYVYLPPGSSMKEPVYISLSDPVYFADPKGN
jgi:hypothetical protein